MNDKSVKFRFYVVVAVAVLFGLVGWQVAETRSEGSTTNKVVVAQGRSQRQLARVVTVQAEDREAAIEKNVEARRSDCESGNKVRAGLRAGVINSEKQVPLLLHLLPQLNTKVVLDIQAKETKRQLAAYRQVNCEKYALKAAPGPLRHKLSLEAQQRQISKLVAQDQATSRKSVESRLVTVKQRCELTEFVLDESVKPKLHTKLAASLAGCHTQLTKLEAEARALGISPH